MGGWDSVGYFNRIASLYGKFPSISAPSSFYKEAASGLKGEYALDVACGTGNLSVLLGKDFNRVIGIDAAPNMIAISKQKASRLRAGNVVFLLAKAQSLPFPDDTFDAVLCLNSIGLLGDDLKALSEMKRVLRPGGLLRCNVMVPSEWLDNFISEQKLLETILKRLPGAKTSHARHLLGILFRLVFDNVLIDWIKPSGEVPG